MRFSGTFDYTLDAKNRLTVPSKMRSQLTGSVVLSRGTETCVSIWIKDEFAAFVEAALDGTGPLDPKRDGILRYFYPNAFETELDSAGRVMLPPKLIAWGQLSKEVVVNGIGDRIEIWDRARWNARNDDPENSDLASLLALPTGA